MKRKITQIAVASDKENGESLFVLVDDGTLWTRVAVFQRHEYEKAVKNNNGVALPRGKFYRIQWEQVEEIPNPNPNNPRIFPEAEPFS